MNENLRKKMKKNPEKDLQKEMKNGSLRCTQLQ